MIIATPGQFPKTQSAFSLKEILVVMAIMSSMASMSLPALKSLSQSKEAAHGARTMAGLIELARKEAITRQTYVWLGFETVQKSGRTSVVLGVVYSQDGSGTNTTASNLIPLCNPMVISGVCLADRTELGERLSEQLSEEPVSPLRGTEGAYFSQGNWAFQGKTLTFTPGGEVLQKGAVGPYDGYVPQMEIGLSECHGGQILPGAQQAALVIHGAKGTVRILQVE